MSTEPVDDDIFSRPCPPSPPKTGPIWEARADKSRSRPLNLAFLQRLLLQAANGLADLERNKVPILRQDLESAWATARSAHEIARFARQFALELDKAEKLDVRAEARFRALIDQVALDCIGTIFQNLHDIRRRLCALEAAVGLPLGAPPVELPPEGPAALPEDPPAADDPPPDRGRPLLPLLGRGRPPTHPARARRRQEAAR